MNKDGPYKTPDYQNIAERIQRLEADYKTLKKDHNDMAYVAEKYKHSTQLSAWAPRWAGAAYYVFLWAALLITVACVLDIKACSDRNTRCERAVENCDCDYLKNANCLSKNKN